MFQDQHIFEKVSKSKNSQTYLQQTTQMAQNVSKTIDSGLILKMQYSLESYFHFSQKYVMCNKSIKSEIRLIAEI